MTDETREFRIPESHVKHLAAKAGMTPEEYLRSLDPGNVLSVEPQAFRQIPGSDVRIRVPLPKRLRKRQR